MRIYGNTERHPPWRGNKSRQASWRCQEPVPRNWSGDWTGRPDQQPVRVEVCRARPCGRAGILDCREWGGGRWPCGDSKFKFQGPPWQGALQTFCICNFVYFYFRHSPSLCWVGPVSCHPSHSYQSPSSHPWSSSGPKPSAPFWKVAWTPVWVQELGTVTHSTVSEACALGWRPG